MRTSPNRLAMLAGLVLTSTVACGYSESPQEATGPTVEEIPVTTSSAEALSQFREGLALSDLGRNVEANARFKAAVAADPGFAYGYYWLSNAALSGPEFSQALDQAAANLEGKSEGERLLVEISRAAFLENASDRALELARQLTESYPNSPRAWLALSGLQGFRNENRAARESAARALELDPKFQGAVFFMGNNNLFGEPKDFARAEEWMRRLAELAPSEAKAYEGLGDVKRAQQDLEGALAAYTKATELDPALSVAQLKKGHVASFLGNIAEARAAYDAGVDSAPPENRAVYANYRAFTHIHGGDVQGSLDELATLADQVEAMGTPAHQVKGVQVFTLDNHATAALHAGKLDQAAAAIARANALRREIGEEMGGETPRLQEATCQMWDGLLAAYRDDYEGAERHAEANRKLVEADANPRKMEAYHWVTGLARLRQGDYAAAVEHLRQADHANTMYIRYQLAVAEEGAGNAAEAAKLFQEVADFNFNTVGFALVGRDAATRAAA